MYQISAQIAQEIAQKEVAMPRKYEMTWEGAPAFRWARQHQGVRHRISCADLGLPEALWTQEGSYLDANRWWKNKRAALEAVPALDAPSAQVARVLETVPLEQLRALVEKGEAARKLLHILSLTGADQNPETAAELLTQGHGVDVDLAGRLLGCQPLKDTDGEELFPLCADPQEVHTKLIDLSTTITPHVLTHRTIGGLTKKWSADRTHEARAGVRSADNAQNQRIALDHFSNFVGPDSPVEAIDYDLWERWYVHCMRKVVQRDADPKAGWSVDYAAKVFGTARSFVRWLWERGVLKELPKNLSAKRYTFQRPEKVIPTYTDAELHRLLSTATGQHVLHLYLMLNIGCTQKDISDLRKHEIDWQAGVIKRRRSKTKHQKNTPEVAYPLWPRTLELLRQYLSDDPVLALTTLSGRPWVRKELHEDGRCNKADGIRNHFEQVRRKAGVNKPLKVFRKTSATRLKSEPRYRDLRHCFLGHAPTNLADKHYSAESQALLGEAVAWLGKQYGLA
jgi:integrase